jgi:hypothetical protein
LVVLRWGWCICGRRRSIVLHLLLRFNTISEVRRSILGIRSSELVVVGGVVVGGLAGGRLWQRWVDCVVACASVASHQNYTPAVDPRSLVVRCVCVGGVGIIGGGVVGGVCAVIVLCVGCGRVAQLKNKLPWFCITANFGVSSQTTRYALCDRPPHDDHDTDITTPSRPTECAEDKARCAAFHSPFWRTSFMSSLFTCNLPRQLVDAVDDDLAHSTIQLSRCSSASAPTVTMSDFHWLCS